MFSDTRDIEDLKETIYVVQKYLDKIAKKIQKLTPAPNLEMNVTGKEKTLVLDYMVFEKIREHLEKNKIYLKVLMDYEQTHNYPTYKVSEIKQKKTCKGKSCRDSRTDTKDKHITDKPKHKPMNRQARHGKKHYGTPTQHRQRRKYVEY